MSHSSCHYVQTYGPRRGGRRPEDWAGQRPPGRWPSRRGDVHEEHPEVAAGGGGGQRSDRGTGCVQKAVDAGIPTVAFNAGINDYKNYGVGMYFGSDEDLAGQTVGSKLAAESPGHTVCVIQEQGQVQLEARCAGVAKTQPDTEVLYVNGRDLPAVQQTIGAKLQQDPSVKNVVTLGADIALAAQKAKTDANSQANIATFDLNADVAQQIQDGGILFSVDQQPYVQGYLAVTALWLNLTNGNDIGGGGPVLTGPSVVDKSNIGPIVEYAKNNTR